MFYRCKEFKLKDASGADINVETISDNNPESEVVAYVNELRNSITVYPNISVGSGYSKLVTVNRTPCYIVSGGSLEITEGQACKTDWISFTEDYYPEEGSE